MDDVSSGQWELMREELVPTRERLHFDSYLRAYKEKRTAESDVAELFHENTKMTAVESHRLRRSVEELQRRPAARFAQATDRGGYGGSELVELPLDVSLEGDLAAALTNRRSRRTFGSAGLELTELSALLLYSCGPSFQRRVEDPAFTVEQNLRTYPSAGGLYPVDFYLFAFDVEDLDAGIYHYSVAEHGLRSLETVPEAELRERRLLEGDVQDTVGVVVVLSGAFWRSKVKYGPRGYRYVLQESGHVAQNLLLVATALGLASVPVAAFHDENVNRQVGLNGVDEAALYAVAVGTRPGDGRSADGDSHPSAETDGGVR